MIETFSENSIFIKEDPRKNRWAIPYHYEALNSRVENLVINNREIFKNKSYILNNENILMTLFFSKALFTYITSKIFNKFFRSSL